MKETVIYTSSNTQRIVMTDYGDGNWFIAKMWRKSSDDDWRTGKGIMLPSDAVHNLSKLLGGGEVGGY